MAITRSRATTTRGKSAPARATTNRKAAAPKKDPAATQYADKEPTDLHRAYANWIVTEVGYNPNEAKNRAAAFLAGVSIATAARPTFQGSEWLSEWREENNISKVGRKRKDEAPADDDDYEDAEESDQADDEDDEGAEESVELSELEEELNGLQIGKLRSAAKDYGVTLSQGMKKAEIVAAILDVVAAEEESEDAAEEGDEEELDLEAIEQELEEMDLPELKAFVKEEFGIDSKRTERKGPLIQRVLDALADDEDADEEEPEEEEEEAPPAKSRARTGARAGAKSGKSADFLF